MCQVILILIFKTTLKKICFRMLCNRVRGKENFKSFWKDCYHVLKPLTGQNPSLHLLIAPNMTVPRSLITPQHSFSINLAQTCFSASVFSSQNALLCQLAHLLPQRSRVSFFSKLSPTVTFHSSLSCQFTIWMFHSLLLITYYFVHSKLCINICMSGPID